MQVLFTLLLPAVAAADGLDVGARADTVRVGDGVITGEIDTPRRDAEIGLEERAQLKRTLEMMGRREVEGDRLWQRRKSPKVSMFSNVVLPGLGQVYNGRRIKTVLMVGAASYYFGNIWLNHKSAQRATARRDKLPPDSPLRTLRSSNDWIEFYKEQAKDYVWWSAAVWLIGILDAWIDAHLYDVRAYTPPPADSAVTDHETTRYITLSIPF
jgi:hypothetical protein